jgi:hypothetical protein
MTTETTDAEPGDRRPSRLRPVLLLAAILLLAGAATASAAPNPAAPNPAANIGTGPLPRACIGAPKGPICVDGIVAALDRARARLGFGPYVLPRDFDSLPGVEQLMILSNLDRLAYGLPVINGLSAALNVVAAAGVTNDGDPDPTALLGGLTRYGWSSNWAGGFANAPEAYYAWMYYDGWSGTQTSNLDCTGPTSSGCWGHRQDVLAFSGQGMLSMGASVSRDAHGQIGYAMTLVWTPVSSWTTYSYTWTQAQKDGAGAAHAENSAARRPRIAVARIG